MTKTVPEALAELGKLYAERNAMYGDDYKYHGELMAIWFHKGVILHTAKDFNRYALFKHIVTKVSRYAANFAAGGHEDSLNDIAVYAQMLQEVDHES